MVQIKTLIGRLVQLVDLMPAPPPVPTAKQGRGRPCIYSDRLFLKALVIMIVKHLHTPYELLTVLEQPTPQMQILRSLLTQGGRYPTRRTWERRLASLPDKLPAQIGALGCHLVDLIQPWANCGSAVAADSTALRSRGGVWHQKHREAGEVPHSSIDTQAHWTKSGWHGWVYGWKLHLITVVANIWIPFAAELTPANHDDSMEAAKLMVRGKCQLPSDIRYLLGDQHYNTPVLRGGCMFREWCLIAIHRGRRRRNDTGREDVSICS